VARAAVAVDSVGCMPGDWVICVGSSAAREAAGSKEYPSDLTIVGIIDHWDSRRADGNHARQGRSGLHTPRAGTESCRPCACWKSQKGALLVATDPVGVPAGKWVFTTSGSAARLAMPDVKVMTDLTICGIIDNWIEE
jgi:microcompartment protein CcmK/EutM